jgi:hypothetical protein
MQISVDQFRLETTSLAIVVLLFGVILVLSYPDITRFKVGPSGFEFERQATELAQKLLVPGERAETAAGTTELVREPDPRGALFTILVEIERAMARLAGMPDAGRRRTGFGSLIRLLSSKGILDRDLQQALEFLRNIRNSAFHGEYLTESQTGAALDLATVVLGRLETKDTQGPSS